MGNPCISFSHWMPAALIAAVLVGILIGSVFRLGLDFAELTAYRRYARRQGIIDKLFSLSR